MRFGLDVAVGEYFRLKAIGKVFHTHWEFIFNFLIFLLYDCLCTRPLSMPVLPENKLICSIDLFFTCTLIILLLESEKAIYVVSGTQ